MRSISYVMIALLVTVLSVGAQQRIELSSGTQLVVREINASFSDPHSMTLDPDGYIWATDSKTGSIWRVSPNGWSAVVGTIALATDPKDNMARGGLFGIALDPDFKSGSPYVYVSYTDPVNNLVIARCEYTNGVLGAPETIKRIEGVPYRNGHSMTMLADGKLLISVGSWDNSDPSTPGKLTGKVLRMNLDGTAPADNPFYDADYPNRPSGYVYVYGQRQTAGFTQLPFNHSALPNAIYSVEPGALSFDEINRLEPGANYGSHKTAGFCKGGVFYTKCPEATFNHTPSSVAYYGSDAIPEWTNSLLVGTITYNGMMVATIGSNGSIANIDPQRPADDVMDLDEDHLIPFTHNSNIERIRDVKISEDGRIYLAVVVVGEQNHGRIIVIENPAVHSPVSVDEFEDQRVGFSAGPNPFSDVVNVSLDEPFTSTWNVRIVDMLGNTVLLQRFEKSMLQVSLPTSQLSSGAYMMFLTDGTKTRSASLVK